KLDAGRYRAMIDCATRLNTPGTKLGAFDEVHALTDVTGFGLLGHLLEVCRASHVGALLEWERVPLLPGVVELVRAGHKTGGSARNWASYGASIDLKGKGEVEQALLTDPQTSGGLLVSCAPNAVAPVLELFHADGFGQAAVIGEIVAGPPTVVVGRP
ncbi:MAG TPA: AIR synthase-related protein, partial [Vicinamibacteria bacterium]